MEKSKRIARWMALCFMATSAAWGQTGAGRELSVGASFGLGLSTVSFVPKVPERALWGTHSGLTVRWLTEKHLGLVAEVNYGQEGWQERFDESALHYSRRLHYVDIPFLTHVYYGGRRARFFFHLGPQIGWCVCDKAKGNVATDAEGEQTTNGVAHPSAQQTMPIAHTFAWGLCGGPGLEVRTGAGIFQLEARLYYALGDIYGNRKADFFARSSSQVLSAKISYLFPLTK